MKEKEKDSPRRPVGVGNSVGNATPQLLIACVLFVTTVLQGVSRFGIGAHKRS